MFRIRSMDCAVEESEIRRALEPVAGIKGLNFQLGARTLAITAPENVVAQALEAIRRVGFDPQPLSAAADGGSHADGDDHDHGSASAGLRPLLIALALALSAEAVAFFAGQGTAATVAEMALALQRVQALEPAGVAARDVAECLRLQLPSIECPAMRDSADRLGAL